MTVSTNVISKIALGPLLEVAILLDYFIQIPLIVTTNFCHYLFFLSIVIICEQLGDLEHGAIEYQNMTEELVFGSVATHSCDEGYFLVGDHARTCEGNGSTVEGKWSGIAPICSGDHESYN